MSSLTFGVHFCGTATPTVGSVTSSSSVAPTAEEIKAKVPSVETHFHIGGCWTDGFVAKVSGAGYSTIKEFLKDIKEGKVPYDQIFRAFDMVNNYISTEALVTEGVALICEEFVANNVVMAELRTGLKNKGSGLEGYLNAVLDGLRGSKDKLQTGLLLSLRRDDKAEHAEATVDLAIKYYKQGVVGLDVSGKSTQGDGGAIRKALLRAKEAGIPLSLHIGEHPDENNEQQIDELRTLNPERLGHCVYLCKEASEWIIENKRPVEICLSSAQLCMNIGHFDCHPGFMYMKEGVPVLICTDDTLIFTTSMPEELAFAAKALGWGIEELCANQRLAKEHSFIQKAL